MRELMFTESPTIELATNFFKNVPVILQYEQTPLIEVVHDVDAGYDVQVPIFHSDGTYLAKVKGSRLFLTKDGEKAGLSLRHLDKLTVCELAGRTVFEMHRVDAAAMKTQAELHTPDGKFVKYANDPWVDLLRTSNGLQLGRGTLFVGNLFDGFSIGILIKEDGSFALGVTGSDQRTE